MGGFLNSKIKDQIENGSAIRAMFEDGKRMAALYGADNVYDFSLGNPNVPAPEAVKEAIIDLLDTTDPVVLHGYMSNAGYEDVRAAVADSLDRRFGLALDASNIVMTVGAGGGMNVALKTFVDPGDEVVVFAPFFTEYSNYINNVDGSLVVIPPNPPTFQPDLEAFEKALTSQTKMVVINTPNNPTGVIYTKETLERLGAILDAKEREFGTSIILFSDEPYRELAYDGVDVPYVTRFYHNTVVGYSFSKTLSLPGERIGYLVLPDSLDDAEEVKMGASIANRLLGFVNAPSLMQKAVARCLDEKADVAYYDRNRRVLYDALDSYGFDCIRPQGAFYLFMKTPTEDEREFVAAAKEEHILAVPMRGFGCPGYVRLAYCTSYETVCASLPAFERLARKYGLTPRSR